MGQAVVMETQATEDALLIADAGEQCDDAAAESSASTKGRGIAAGAAVVGAGLILFPPALGVVALGCAAASATQWEGSRVGGVARKLGDVGLKAGAAVKKVSNLRAPGHSHAVNTCCCNGVILKHTG